MHESITGPSMYCVQETWITKTYNHMGIAYDTIIMYLKKKKKKLAGILAEISARS